MSNGKSGAAALCKPNERDTRTTLPETEGVNATLLRCRSESTQPYAACFKAHSCTLQKFPEDFVEAEAEIKAEI
jgi:hypothetical protein